jgi:hypothetical protein
MPQAIVAAGGFLPFFLTGTGFVAIAVKTVLINAALGAFTFCDNKGVTWKIVDE